MRVIAGVLGGRQFDSPHSAATHPMGDRVRGALFNTLGDIDGLTVLDPFAGTGALSFEAVSRGASRALAIESDKPAQRTLAANIRLLGLGKRVRLITANSSTWSDAHTDEHFDVIVADPPFHNLQPKVVQKLARHLVKDGLYILNWPGKAEPPAIDPLEIIVRKQYGDTQLIFYR